MSEINYSKYTKRYIRQRRELMLGPGICWIWLVPGLDSLHTGILRILKVSCVLQTRLPRRLPCL